MDDEGTTAGITHPDLNEDFSPNVIVDDLKEGVTPPVTRRSSTMQESAGLSSSHHSSSSVKLAARMVRIIIIC